MHQEDATEQHLQWDLSEPHPAGDELDWLQQPQLQGQHQLPWLAEAEGPDQAEAHAGTGFLSEATHGAGALGSHQPPAAHQAATPAEVDQQWQAEADSQGEPAQEAAGRSGWSDGGPNTKGQGHTPWLQPDQPALAASGPDTELPSGQRQQEQGHGEHQGQEQSAPDAGPFWAGPVAASDGMQGLSAGGAPGSPDWPEHEIPLDQDEPYPQPSGAAAGAAGQPAWPAQQQPGQEGLMPGAPGAYHSWGQQAEGAWPGTEVQGQGHLPAGSDAHSWGQRAEGTSHSWQQPQQPANPWTTQGTPSQHYTGWDGSYHQHGHDSQQGSQDLHTPFAQYQPAAAGLGWDQQGAAQPAASLYGYPTTVDMAVRSPDGRPPIALMALGFAGRSLLWQSSTVLSESAGPCMGSCRGHVQLGLRSACHPQRCSGIVLRQLGCCVAAASHSLTWPVRNTAQQRTCLVLQAMSPLTWRAVLGARCTGARGHLWPATWQQRSRMQPTRWARWLRAVSGLSSLLLLPA